MTVTVAYKTHIFHKSIISCYIIHDLICISTSLYTDFTCFGYFYYYDSLHVFVCKSSRASDAKCQVKFLCTVFMNFKIWKQNALWAILIKKHKPGRHTTGWNLKKQILHEKPVQYPWYLGRFFFASVNKPVIKEIEISSRCHIAPVGIVVDTNTPHESRIKLFF